MLVIIQWEIITADSNIQSSNKIKACKWTKVTCLVGSKLKMKSFKFYCYRTLKDKKKSKNAKYCEIKSYIMLHINCEILLFFKIQHNKHVNCKVNKAAAYSKSNKSISRHCRYLLSATKIYGNETKPLILHYHTVCKCKQQQLHNPYSRDMQSENLKRVNFLCAIWSWHSK